MFASRPSSCARKSSRRPIAPPPPRSARAAATCVLQPVELLADIRLGGEQDRLLIKAVLVKPARGLHQRRDAFGEPGADRLGLSRGIGVGGQRSASRSRRAARSGESPAPCPRASRAVVSFSTASSRLARTPAQARATAASSSAASSTSTTPRTASSPSMVGGESPAFSAAARAAAASDASVASSMRATLAAPSRWAERVAKHVPRASALPRRARASASTRSKGGGQTQAKIETLGVDGLDLERPAPPAARPRRAGEARHAHDAHLVSFPVVAGSNPADGQSRRFI